MVDTPGPVNSSNAPARSLARWIWLAVAILLLGGAAIWFGDVPGRFQASEAMREGRVALLKSDYASALSAFRRAALLRPTDEAIIQRYEQTQTTWFELAERRVEKLEPAEAYRTWRELPATEPVLTEPVLGRFRARGSAIEASARQLAEAHLARAREHTDAGRFDEANAELQAAEPFKNLLPELPARRQEVRDAQLAAALASAQEALTNENFAPARETLAAVAALGAGRQEYTALVRAVDEADLRAALRAAEAAVQKADFATAQAELDRAGKLGVLPEELAAARLSALAQTRAHVSNELALGISSGDRAKVEAALDHGEKYAEWKKVPAEALLSPANLPAFLSALQAFNLGGEHQGKFFDRLDLPLVVWARPRFQDDTGVEEHLRAGFREWSRAAAAAKLPGCALLLEDLAQAHGAEPDEAWRREAMATAATAATVAIAVQPSAPDRDAPEKLNAEATAALRTALGRKLGAWPKLVDYDANQPATVVLQGRYGGFTTYDDATRTERKVRYQSGTRQVRNAEADEVYEEFKDLSERINNLANAVNEKQAGINQVNSNPNASAWERSQVTDRAIEVASDTALLRQWRSQREELRARGKSLPQYLAEPVYADETYEYIQHAYTCTVTWAVSAALHGQEVEVTLHRASTTFRTDEIAGNASHGVPVKSAQPVPKAKLLPGLARDLVQQAANVDEIIAQLPGLTVESFVAFHGQHNTSPIGQAEQFLDLAYGWELAGRPLDDKAKIAEAARHVLNLP